MNGIKWVFFDLGWTLIDETESHRIRLNAVRKHLSRFGHNVSIDELMSSCELASTEFAPSPFRGMLSCLGLSDSQRGEVLNSVVYDHRHEVLYPCVPELLSSLSEHFMLGVIANQSEGTERRLKACSIRDHFSLIFASAEQGLLKPDPKIFQSALRNAQCEPKEAVMFGDRLDNDIRPAKAQGWKTIRVLQGFSRLQKPRVAEEEPDRTISRIVELSSILLKIEQPTILFTQTGRGRPS